MLPDDDNIMNETTKLLRDLIRINTTNPPGNETKAAQYLFDFFSQEDFEPEILESAEERGNLLVRLPGKDDQSLLFLSHLDVVPASPEGWDLDPWKGEIKDGFIYGRGALDCKSLVAIEALTLVLLKREGFRPKGDLIFAAVANEEKGGKLGAGWLVKNHPDKVGAKFVINEGGGIGVPVKGVNKYLIQVAEKGVFWTKIQMKGTPGHASIPTVGENALVSMAAVVEKLGKHRTAIEIQDVVREMIFKLVGKGLGSQLLLTLFLTDRLLNRLRKNKPEMSELFRALVRITIAPTMFHAGVKENIIPETAEAILDCRLLPGQDFEDLKAEFAKALGDLSQLKIEHITQDPGTVSPHDSELFVAIERQIAAADPGATCVPFMVSGGTDSRFFRKAFGSVAYGFQPIQPDIPLSELIKLVHGRNERISQENLVFGTKILYHLTKDLLS